MVKEETLHLIHSCAMIDRASGTDLNELKGILMPGAPK